MRSSRTLSDVGFDGWISIEDGVDGFSQLQQSVAFLRSKMRQYWPTSQRRRSGAAELAMNWA